MPDLFISYARADSRDFVARLSAALEGLGKDTWVDLDDIPAASVWSDDLREGIASSDSFCFVISPASVRSPHCREELDHAVALGKRLLPVLHLEVPDAEVPEPVATRNWIPQLGRFTDDFDTSLATLVSAIETDLDWVREHTRWGLRAEEWERRGQDRSLLARGSDLDQAEAFIGGGGSRDPAPTELQGRYVVASRRAATRRQRQLVTGVSIALVVAIVLGVLALLQRNTAVDQKHQAEDQRAKATSRALAANAFLNLPTDPELSVLLGLEAAKASPTSEAESALRSGILDDRQRGELDHEGAVTSASYSPDGSTIVTTSEDGTAALWDAGSGKQIAVLKGHASPPEKARWSADSSRVVTIAQDGTARVWDGHTGAPVITIHETDTDKLSDVAITADGSVVMTCSFVAKRVHIWSATTGKQIASIPSPFVSNLALLPDESGMLLASDTGVELWSRYGPVEVNSWPGGSGGPTVLATSADGQRFVSAWGDGSATVRTMEGSLLAHVQHDGAVESAAFSPDGQQLATASDDGTVRITDLGSGQPVTTFSGHQGGVQAVAFSPDGSEVASGGSDGRIQLWRPDSGGVLATLTGHRAPVTAVDFALDGERLLSASDDSTARLWSVSPSGGAFEPRTTVDLGDADLGTFSTDGRYAVARGEDGDSYDVEVVDVTSGEVRKAFDLGADEQLLQAVSPDGSTVAISTSDGVVQLRHTDDGSLVSTVDAAGAESAAFDSDGTRVAIGTAQGDIGVFDVASGREDAVFEGLADDVGVGGVAFSPDGTELASAETDGTARVWDVDSGKQRRVFQAFGPRTPNSMDTARVLFSPDGRLLFTAINWENDGRLWDLATGEQLATLQGRGGGVFGAWFSSSGRFLVTSEYLGNVRLWDGRNGRLLTDVVDDAAVVNGVAFSADETMLEVVGRGGDPETGRLQIYACDVCGGLDDLVELAKTRVTRTLTATEKATYLTNE